MNIEYKIEWDIPEDYDPSAMLQQLPSPISRKMTEIYNYRVGKDGVYLFDNLVDSSVVGCAMKIFVDEALAHSNSVQIRKLKD